MQPIEGNRKRERCGAPLCPWLQLLMTTSVATIFSTRTLERVRLKAGETQ
jgi:hypothetical protein